MNIYFLVEGSRTEVAIYPQWLNHLKPELKRIDNPFLLNSNSSLDKTFYMFSGGGYPSLLDNHLVNAVNDINNIPKIDYFVICLDSEERTVEETKRSILEYMNNNHIVLTSAKLFIIVQNCCIETWLLGNRKVFSRYATNPELLKCIEYYNTKDDDPELMTSISSDYNRAQFHAYYLKLMLREKHIKYTKKKPDEVCKKHYLDELISRNSQTNHIVSFGDFIGFCNSLE
jgi:hypothetical protein